MHLAAASANKKGVPIALDPLSAGATKCVDAQESDLADGQQGRIDLARELARSTGNNSSGCVLSALLAAR